MCTVETLLVAVAFLSYYKFVHSCVRFISMLFQYIRMAQFNIRFDAVAVVYYCKLTYQIFCRRSTHGGTVQYGAEQYTAYIETCVAW